MSGTVDRYANPADVPEGTLVRLFFDAVDRMGGKAAYLAPPDADAPSFDAPGSDASGPDAPGSGAGGESQDAAGRPWSYAQVEELVRQGAAALAESGVRRGERVAILSENRLEWALADWSCLCAGAVDVPIYSTLPAVQVAYILKDSGAKLVFASDGEQAAKAQEATADWDEKPEIVVFDNAAAGDGITAGRDFMARGEGADPHTFREKALKARPGDLATMIYTSGTTGAPKGVMLTHNNVASNVWASKQMLEVRDTDTTLSFLPLSHVFQRMVDYLFFSAGCTVAHGSIESVAEDIKRLRPTVMCSVPRLYEKVYQKVLDAGGLKGKLVGWATAVGRQAAVLREQGKEPSGLLGLKYAVADRLVFAKIRLGVGGRLRFFVSGGAPLAPEINRFFLGAGITILEGYGLSETSPVTNVNTLDAFRIGTVGRPVPGTEIRIAEDGEILVRGPQVMKGYHGLEEKTREVISEDGWFSTGDIGELSADGFLSITDRKKDLIKTSGGKYVAPQSIENLLKGNPYVDQAVVVGNGRKFVSVLVVPAFDKLSGWAAGAGVDASTSAALLADDRCRRFLKEQVFSELRDLARFETPKKIGLLAEPFTIENGALTPTQKVKRRVVEERCAAMIDAFYDPAAVDRTVFVTASS